MRASIISVGSELLRGTLLDTNAQFFAQELYALGAEVVQATQVPDELMSITQAMTQAAKVSDIVLVSGGLGPTDDDLTREAIIELTGESPQIDDDIVNEIRSRFTQRGDKMPSRNEKQAWTIPSADVIPNPHGTAPGWFVTLPNSAIVTLPGPPRENRPMWRDHIRSRVVGSLANQAIVGRTIKTIGIGESAVADRLSELIELDWPIVATYAKRDGVHVTITAAHENRSDAEHALRDASETVLDLLRDYVYASDDESLAAAIVQPLAATRTRIAIWEAGSAGQLASLLLSDPVSESLVADSRSWPGAYAHASDVREFARATAQTTGVGTACALVAEFSDPIGGVADGVVAVAFVHAGTIVDTEYRVRGTPDEIRRRSVLIAAEFLWLEIRRAAQCRGESSTSTPSSKT